MSTAAVIYQVASNQPQNTRLSGPNNQPIPIDVNSAVLQISYTDQNGVNQVVSNYSSASGIWTLAFTGTVGQPYALSAVEIQTQNVPYGVTVTVFKNGSQVATANNFTGGVTTPDGQKFSATQLPAGVSGTL